MKKPCILVVDDNPTNLALISDTLEFEGYTVQQAADAAEMRRAIAAAKPDLILMDVGLPDVDGLTLTRQLKADPATKHIPIAIVTAAAMKGDEEKAMTAGGDAYIAKPIDTRALPAQVARLLGRKVEAVERPTPTPNSGPAPKAKAATEQETRSGRILIVDDLAVNRLLLREILEASGHAVTEAADGVEAIATLERIAVTAVISDALMPNMDGFRLCLELRRSEQFARIPFVLYTSTYDSPADRSLATKVGADGYLLKPAPPEAIFAALDQAIRIAADRPKGTKPVVSEEMTVIKHYNAALVAKLEEKNAELQETLERFRQLAENIREVFWLTDPEKNSILYVSPAYERIWGRSCESLMKEPRGWLEAIHEADRERVREAATSKQAAGTYDEQYRITRPDGTVRWVRDRAFPVRDDHGRVYRVAGVAEDITETKELQAQILRTQRLEAIGTLASGIAHDMNNILAPIMMSAPMLRMKLAPADVEKTLATVESSARRGADLVKQLLMFSRGVEGERGAVAASRLIGEIVKMAQQTFPKNITVRVQAPANMWAVRGDASQLHQVLLNLLVNARDAMPKGGLITVGAANVELAAGAKELPRDSSPGAYLRIQVTDTGTGIPPEIMDRIFDPFFTTKEAGHGTGLGLSTVLGVVRSHGGFVRVASDVGTGTTFEVLLPAMPSAEEKPTAEPAAAGPAGANELILVVDDEASIRQVLRDNLSRKGYRVVTAGDGAGAAVVFARDPGQVRLVITDLDMPFMDGLELLRAVRRMKPGIPVIVSTGAGAGKAALQRLAEIKAIGVSAILEKPHSVADLFAAVARALSAR